ncbi:hypothetical protein BT93_F0042 [Corymbia citriodora subsp. variegata]|nr:hypothetical protein BT93_F0042 [Corymbia citriodora subsp. variegata]
MKVVHRLLLVAVTCWLREGGAPTVAGDPAHACGGMPVPYPFGLNSKYSRSPEFLLNCNTSEGSRPRLLLGHIPIRKISVEDSTMVVSQPEIYDCYDKDSTLTNSSGDLFINVISFPQYRLSYTRNNLIVLGCDTYALMADKDEMFRSGCISYCNNSVDLAKETNCSGLGCCQASIPKGLKTLHIRLFSFDEHKSVWQFNPCGVAFVGDRKSFNISNRTLPTTENLGKRTDLVLDWMIGWNVTCEQAMLNQSSYACNTDCKDYADGPGYRCFCKDGYKGNPYNRFHGCQDECKDPERNPCPGGDGGNRAAIAVAVLAVPFFGITMTASVSFTMRVRLKGINFRRNGGEFFLERKVRIFLELELAKATNNYDYRNKLGNGGFGSVHKGTLEKHRDTVVVWDTVVVVKKPKDVDKSLINKDFQRELEILMKTRCKNVVKLKGICLETKIPSLVYEYIPNGTLFQLIHQNEPTISWEERFKIATEAAHALKHMHSKKICHGNIKSANILLDQNNSVKISDFGTSVLMSPKHRHIIATQKEDSLGYIDPEYLITRELKTQSDVYSFGAVLVELLTRKKLYDIESENSINTIHYFISSVKGDMLSNVIDFEGASEDEVGKVRSIAKIAVWCLDPSGANRPAMSEVAKQLVSINRSSKVEEENEDLEEENEDPEEEWDPEKVSCLEEATSSCLSCLGLD